MYTIIPILEPCKSRVVQTTAGVMIKSKEDIEASSVKSKNKFIAIDVNEYKTVFLPYDTYYDIKVGSDFIRAIDHNTIQVNLSLPEPYEWLQKLKHRSIMQHQQNLTRMSENLKKQQEIIDDMNKPTYRFSQNLFWWVPPLW